MLYIAATPIGNLEDITLRTIRILKEADLILCEDTRVTGILLRHLEIPHKEFIVINAFNEAKNLDKIIERISGVQSAVLVSDAGTPGISDPGVRLVNAARKAGIEIAAIPGPSSVTAALSIAGIPTDSYLYEGFLPLKKGRQKKLTQLSEIESTIVLFESSHRIEKLLNELSQFMPDRLILVMRELTKKFEETWEGFPGELIAAFPSKISKGEFVVLIAKTGFRRSDELKVNLPE
ncbi:MAG: 16S rRNA (cytidine(1402)-2'-O)-methyltransferase [Ignavibacteriales bacterium]|nr:MAG: 16S rRNA (cytidine(1402)-2'-O)-methyltransferase [Ignavibacteriales bacterium]